MGSDTKTFFTGYPAPTSNTTYTPNQFFDVVLPRSSRGVVRLVGYMIRKTLGWCDPDGNPQETQILISYSDLEKNAGISRDMIRRAITEALDGGFIICVREGRPKAAGQSAVSALYELHWDESGQYTTDPNHFQGFYAGQGNHTYIPNAFFDFTLTHETLAVIRVVGAIIRNTIGWQTKYGFRRQQVELSFTAIQRRTRISSRQTLSEAIQQAIEHNHIFRVAEGYFDPHAGKASKAAKYAVRWQDNASYPMIGQKTVPDDSPIGQKTVPENSYADRSENRTGIGQKTVPHHRSENRTDIEIKQLNKTLKRKQQQPKAPAVVETLSTIQNKSFQLLTEQGFTPRDAHALAYTHPAQTIENQINWLRKRTPTRNPLGMLRRAIEENWNEPDQITYLPNTGHGFTFAQHFYAGRNGNPDAPVAVPTSNDVQVAEGFVERLLEVWPDEERIPKWGRDFGDFVRRAERLQTTSIVSFVNSVRTHGDAFFAEVRAAYKQHVMIAEAQHQESFLEHYIAFQKTRLASITEEQPQLYSEFLEVEKKRRDRILQNRILRQEQREAELRRFEREESRVSRYWNFIQDQDPTLAPDFWEWDTQMNPNAFNHEKVCP